MTSKSAKTIFYVGALSSAILFLALTWDTHNQVHALTNADRLSDDVVEGKRVFQKYNCNDCHTILGFGGYYAPDLTRVYDRRGENYIRGVVAQPELVLANSFRKMPHQNLTPTEIDRLVDFFRWVNDIDTQDWPPQDSKKRRTTESKRLIGGSAMTPGAALFKGQGCIACHSIGGVGGDAGPALDDTGTRMTPEQIRQYIYDPASVNPQTNMPGYQEMTPSDLNALAEFLARRKGEAQ